MQLNFARYQTPSSPTNGPGTGSRALMSYTLSRWPYARSMGIYNNRSVRGGSRLSHHAEGRALDIGIPQPGPGRADSEKGNRIIAALCRHGRRLGIDHVIWDRRIWSGRSPSGRAYTGVNPHYDHIHLGLTRAAAERLNLATLLDVVGPADSRKVEPDPDATHRVTASSLRVRASASTSAQIRGELPHQTQVTVLGTAPTTSDGYEWVEVEAKLIGGGLTGWVAADFLEEIDPPPTTHYVQASSLRLRDEPTTDGNILIDLTNGTGVVVLGDDSRTADGHEWVRVRATVADRTETGWVARSYLVPRS